MELYLILGGIASIFFIVANYVTNRRVVVLLQTLAIIILVIQYGPVMGLWGVAAINMIFIIRNGLYSLRKSQQYADIISIISIAIFILAYFIIQASSSIPVEIEIFLAFPLLAAVLNTLAFMQPSIIGFKIVFGASFLSWVVFDIIKQQWGNIIGDSFSVIAAIISIILILNKQRKSEENIGISSDSN